MEIDLKTIRELLAVVSNTDITELTIESGDQRITVKKSASGAAVAQSVPVGDAPYAVQQPLSAAQTISFEPKVSPAREAVGVIGASSSPRDKQFERGRSDYISDGRHVLQLAFTNGPAVCQDWRSCCGWTDRLHHRSNEVDE